LFNGPHRMRADLRHCQYCAANSSVHSGARGTNEETDGSADRP
jgi:hypothetical protein